MGVNSWLVLKISNFMSLHQRKSASSPTFLRFPITPTYRELIVNTKRTLRRSMLSTAEMFSKSSPNLMRRLTPRLTSTSEDAGGGRFGITPNRYSACHWVHLVHMSDSILM